MSGFLCASKRASVSTHACLPFFLPASPAHNYMPVCKAMGDFIILEPGSGTGQKNYRFMNWKWLVGCSLVAVLCAVGQCANTNTEGKHIKRKQAKL